MKTIIKQLDWDYIARKKPFTASEHSCEECGAQAETVSNVGFFCHKCWSRIEQIRATQNPKDQLENERIDRMRKKTL